MLGEGTRKNHRLQKKEVPMKLFQVTVTIDRPIGYVDDYGNCYPINYGYVAGVIGVEKNKMLMF